MFCLQLTLSIGHTFLARLDIYIEQKEIKVLLSRIKNHLSLAGTVIDKQDEDHNT